MSPLHSSERTVDNTVLCIVYLLFFVPIIMGGAAYVVFGMDHSGWWFVGALMLVESCRPAALKFTGEKESES